MILAYVSFGLASLIGFGIFWSQRNFANLVTEFGVESGVLTSITCSPLLLLILLGIAIASLLVGHTRVPKANLLNALFIVCSLANLAVYVFGMIGPLSQLANGLTDP